MHPRRARVARVSRAAVVLFLALAAGVVAGGPTRVAASSLPPIGHVWVIVLENKSGVFDSSNNTYLARTIAPQGAYIPGYYGTGHESADNYIAMISGQGPTPDTQADCQDYQDINPGGAPGPTGQYFPASSGCVYPANVKTLPDQLVAAGHTWKGYMEDMGQDSGRDTSFTCSAKTPAGAGTRDTTQSAEGASSSNGNRGDQYALRHDPFMYFHTIIDPASCASHVVELQDAQNGLTADLSSTATTPDYSFITPNLCDDGHDASGCSAPDIAGSSVGGLTAIDHFLRVYVPEIVNSPAFRQDGMLVITVDEADGTQPQQDSTSCCGESQIAGTSDSNSPSPGISGSGGGKVGTVVLSPYVHPGTKSNQEYNHFNLLRTVEDVFHTTGGVDGHHLGWAATISNDSYAPCQQSKPSDPCQTDFGGDVFTDPSGQSHPQVGGSAPVSFGGQSGTGQQPGPVGPSTAATGDAGSAGGAASAGLIDVSPVGPPASSGSGLAPIGTSSSRTPSPDAAPAATSLLGPKLATPGGFSFALFLLLALPPVIGIASVLVFVRRQGT